MPRESSRELASGVVPQRDRARPRSRLCLHWVCGHRPRLGVQRRASRTRPVKAPKPPGPRSGTLHAGIGGTAASRPRGKAPTEAGALPRTSGTPPVARGQVLPAATGCSASACRARRGALTSLGPRRTPRTSRGPWGRRASCGWPPCRPRHRRGCASPAPRASCPTGCAAPPAPRGSRRGRGGATGRCAAPRTMRGAQVVVERGAGREGDEEHELAHRLVGVVTLEVHDEAVGHLGQPFDDRVEVAGAEAHATPVQRGVGAARDHARAVVGERDPVAVPPHARVVVEVRVPAASRRSDRPRSPTGIDGMGSVTTSSPCTPGGHTVPSGANASTAHPSNRQLISPARTGSNGTAPTNAAHTSVPPLTDAVCTCGADDVADPAEAVGRQRRAGGTDAAQPVRWRHDPRLAARHQERRAHTEHVDVGVGGQLPQRAEVGVRGVAVEQHDGRADEQPRHEVVPHHPAGGGEPEEAVAGAEVVVQGRRLAGARR